MFGWPFFCVNLCCLPELADPLLVVPIDSPSTHKKDHSVQIFTFAHSTCFVSYSVSRQHVCACSVTVTWQSLALHCSLSAAVCIVHFSIQNAHGIKTNVDCRSFTPMFWLYCWCHNSAMILPWISQLSQSTVMIFAIFTMIFFCPYVWCCVTPVEIAVINVAFACYFVVIISLLA